MCEIAGLKFTPTSALLMFFVIGSCSDVKDSLEQVEDFFFESDYKEPPGEPIEGFMAFPKGYAKTDINAVFDAMKIGEEEV